MSLKEELIEHLTFMIDTIPEELHRIVIDAIGLFIRSSIRFGSNSNQAKGCLNVIKERSRILKEEKHLLKLILQNIDNIDLDEACDIADTLDILNEQTYMSYDDILYQVEIALDLNNPDRIIMDTSRINSLITTDEYKNQVFALIKKEA